jgi:hypothetical protein
LQGVPVAGLAVLIAADYEIDGGLEVKRHLLQGQEVFDVDGFYVHKSSFG